MSTEAAAKFLEQLANDDSMKAELDQTRETRQDRIQAVVALGEIKGYEFTADDCATIVETAKKVQDGELTEAELEAVAGGVNKDEAVAHAFWELVRWIKPDGPHDERPVSSTAGVRG